jgi:hypothetical protein
MYDFLKKSLVVSGLIGGCACAFLGAGELLHKGQETQYYAKKYLEQKSRADTLDNKNKFLTARVDKQHQKISELNAKIPVKPNDKLKPNDKGFAKK